MKFKKKDDAVRYFVATLNSVPTKMVIAATQKDEDLYEVTVPVVGDEVDVYGTGECGKVLERDYLYCKVKFEDGTCRKIPESILCVCHENVYPRWGTMWSFPESADEYWLGELDGIRKMSECGFRIYHSDQFGYFFGTDAGGTDFYKECWAPLYDARGLHWHTEG